MKTGEGKTLVSTLPAYLNSLTGKGVHIVTVNDYLAKRDSEWMGKVFNFLGTSTGCITNDLDDFQRKKNNYPKYGNYLRGYGEVAYYKNNNLKIVGIGCPGRATTLLSYCNLDSDALSYIAEQSTSLKLGLFTPGTYIPIVDEKIMFEDQPDIAIILSWHYWEPIVDKLRAKGLKSKIIIPLPEVRIID